MSYFLGFITLEVVWQKKDHPKKAGNALWPQKSCVKQSAKVPNLCTFEERKENDLVSHYH